MALSTNKHWSCRICTFENASDSSQCEMCSTARYNETEWQCISCKTRNSSQCNKCTVCYRVRAPIFSDKDIVELNEFAATNFNTTMSPSHSAPNPVIESNKSNNNISSTSSLYNKYTSNNKKNKCLLPIDIQISNGIKPKLGPPSIRVHYDEDFNPSTSPSPSSSISDYIISGPPSLTKQQQKKQQKHFFDPNSSPSPELDHHENIKKNKNKQKKKNKKRNKTKMNENINVNINNLGFMEKMVRKYSDPKDQKTTTLLIEPQIKSDQYSLNELNENMHCINNKIVEILKKRHNDNYYGYIVDKRKYDYFNKTDNEIINNMIYNNDEHEREGILICIGCKNTKMIHAKCPDDRSTIKCYECGIYINKLGMEYYHCPNIQLSLHQNVGRDLCCICGAKNMMKQDKEIKDIKDIKDINIDVEEEMVLYQNYLKYQTFKFEEIIPTILIITSLDDFEYIYTEIYKQTLEFGNKSDLDSDIISILDSHSKYLDEELIGIDTTLRKSKSNKNDIQNEYSSISNDIIKVNSEITALMKKINILTKKKQDLQCQMQSILDVLNTMNNHQNDLEIISTKTYLYKEKIDERIKCIENYNDKINILQNMFNQKRQILFGNYQIWTQKQCIMQLKHYLNINNIKLNSLQTIIKQFESKSIKGKDLINLNELTFKMMNINDYDQKILLLWIEYISSNNDNNNNQNDDDNKMDISSPNSPSFRNRQKLLCSICMVNNVNVIINPCGHICICDDCSIKMVKQICPVCRIQITDIKHCFFAVTN